MSVFEEHVMPRIKLIECEINVIREIKIPHAIKRENYIRVGKLAERAIDLTDLAIELSALESAPDSIVSGYLAQL